MIISMHRDNSQCQVREGMRRDAAADHHLHINADRSFYRFQYTRYFITSCRFIKRYCSLCQRFSLGLLSILSFVDNVILFLYARLIYSRCEPTLTPSMNMRGFRPECALSAAPPR